MSDELKRIVATVGPYAGQNIDVTAAEAKKAIAEGWARDPFADPSTGSAAEPKELTEEERWNVLQAANKGAARLRGGEANDKADDKAKAAADADAKAEDGPSTSSGKKSMEAEKPAAGYETRGSKSK